MQSNTIHVPKISGLILWAAVATILLVILSDVLLFDANAGINLFLATIALALAIASIAWRKGRFRQGIAGFITALALALPLIEAATLPGLLTAGLGLCLCTLIAGRLLPNRLEPVPGTVLRFLLSAPTGLIRDIIGLRPPMQRATARKASLWLVAWIVPLGLGAVFAYLFVAANPLIETVLSSVRPQAALEFFDPVRLLFWLLVAAIAWPFLRPRLFRRYRRQAVSPGPTGHSVWLGSAAIFRSLVVFNALFAIQTMLDLAYLWGGVALPDGMSHAEYAHRGAYPLIVTALLAAAFVLAAMREDSPARHNKIVRVLVYLFIAQNVLLCFSAMFRLKLYVEAYSLTELRLAAGIWMGLVAVGLVLILLRIWLRRSNGWLVASNLLALTVVLYGSAMADLFAYIARFNVEYSRELTGQGLSIDLDYLSLLGPSAIPALDRLTARLPAGSGTWSKATAIRSDLVRELRDDADDWRGWSWRTQRLKDYLAIHAVASAPPKRQNGTVLVR